MTQEEDTSSFRGWNRESGEKDCLYSVNGETREGPLHLLSGRGVRA